MIGAITLISTLGWLFSARKWFKGPQRLISEEDIAALESEYEAAHGGEHILHDKVAEDYSVMQGVGSKA